MSMTSKLMAAAAALSLTAGAAAAESHMSPAGNPMVDGVEMMPDMTIVENASNAGNLSTLVAAVQAAGLADTLAGEGPFTVLAPTNDAFAKLDQTQLDDLMKPENQAALAKILTCHVIPGAMNTEELAGQFGNEGGEQELETVGGCMVTIRKDAVKAEGEEHFTITDERGQVAEIMTPDVFQSNGVVHVIDTVLLPAE
ncbi:Uncaracterized surface protein containing fasciclin (FAS1) repeats [Loktanella atrilutea]|uniref:Uncaracterized surface protein containing fasciclin (FAS1) repeats n=2 Tax=Loktanella atrilutea TaxID=366533 RepID=A0A1M4SXJ7_LOKAT|nr:Uncaracterized surface protein containing fasciclin (FAS1) repeats [Loktanella atrilutea]